MNYVLAIIVSSAICSKIELPEAQLLENNTDPENTGAGPPLRIIYGTPAKIAQFPYQVSLRYIKSPNYLLYFAAGSLISAEWILTAAHCIHSARRWTVMMGSLNHETHKLGPGELVLNADIGIGYPDYDTASAHDVGLIKLPRPVRLTSTIQPVRLPRRSDAYKRFLDLKVTMSGWGKTDVKGRRISDRLMYTHLKIISNNECDNFFGDIYEHTICARGYGRNGICKGDSGGPLVMEEEDGVRTILGILSFQWSKGCYPKIPGGYMRVGYHLDWIHRHTGIPIRP